MIYLLSLGSNLGNRTEHLRQALAYLEQKGKVISVSSVYRTAPVQMPAHSGYFLNMAVKFSSSLSPADLLKQIKLHEAESGRDLSCSHCQPRTIDIDILFAENRIMDTPQLTIPHPRLKERAFVLEPLCEIAPDFICPRSGQSVRKIYQRLAPGQEITFHGSIPHSHTA